MKIAIIASGQGEKALHLHDFFKEGNRVEIVSLLTDNRESEVARAFTGEGIPVDVLADLDEEAVSNLTSVLRNDEVVLLVVDGYEGELPAPLVEEYREAVLYPSSVQSAPLEIIETVKRLKDNEEKKAQTQTVADEPKDTSDTSGFEEGSLEDEWAKALDIKPPHLDEPQPTAPEHDPGSNPPQTSQPPQPVQPAQGRRSFFRRIPPLSGFQRPQNLGGATPPPSEREPMPDTYLVWSVLATILCCLIPGVIAIVYSSSVSSKYYSGDIEGAKRASRNAQIWVIVSVVTGIIWGTLYLPLSLLSL